jgi:hypothetical protein
MIFSKINVTGIEIIKWDRAGFAFKAIDSEAKLSYETFTCAEYYERRGRKTKIDCEKPIVAITNVMGSFTGCDFEPPRKREL